MSNIIQILKGVFMGLFSFFSKSKTDSTVQPVNQPIVTPVQPKPVTPIPIQPAPITPVLKNLDKLKGHVPDSVISQIDTLSKFNINSQLRLAHFLAQAAHESNKFTAVYENLNYSAEALMKVFAKYFPDINSANSYARQPERIGSRVYANRMGNGDEASREGFFYRGRGFLQTSGKFNYDNFSKFIGEDCVSNPDLIATKYPLASAAFFFNSNNIWTICDKGSDDATVTAVSKVVNGGIIGLSERIAKFKEFYSLII
jgi:putative chitinase